MKHTATAWNDCSSHFDYIQQAARESLSPVLWITSSTILLFWSWQLLFNKNLNERVHIYMAPIRTVLAGCESVAGCLLELFFFFSIDFLLSISHHINNNKL